MCVSDPNKRRSLDYKCVSDSNILLYHLEVYIAWGKAQHLNLKSSIIKRQIFCGSFTCIHVKIALEMILNANKIRCIHHHHINKHNLCKLIYSEAMFVVLIVDFPDWIRWA